MTFDEIIAGCAGSSAEDWAFWVYLCGGGASPPQCAAAVYLADRHIGLAWSPAEDEPVPPAARPLGSWGGQHWVELRYGSTVVARCLAVDVAGEPASLPAPQAEVHEDGVVQLWVGRRQYELVRLANLVDPDSDAFDECFERSGIEVK